MILSEDIAQLALIAADRYFDLNGLSTYSGLSISTLRKYIKLHGLPHFKPDGKVLVKKSEFDRWLDQFRGNRNMDIEETVDKVMQSLE